MFMRDSTTRFVFALSGGFCMGILFSRQPPRAASAPIAVLEHHCTVERPSVFQACTLRNSIGAGVSCSSVYSSHGFSWAPPLPTFRQKGDLPRILQAEGHRVGVEVGVLDGRFAEWMLKTWRSCESYSLVDPWVAHDDTYRDASAQRTQDAAAFMAAATDRMKPFGARARILRNTSVAAAATFADASVDFVFIDARHTYDAVSEDLRAWWPKIRPGGILAGHDYGALHVSAQSPACILRFTPLACRVDSRSGQRRAVEILDVPMGLAMEGMRRVQVCAVGQSVRHAARDEATG